MIVTPAGGPTVTVDDISVAQFIYFIINNRNIRDVLDTVTRKVVLLLGRFQPEQKAVLDRVRDALREKDLVPVLVDFDASPARDVTETVTLLARMARFVIADLTEAKSVPHELQAIAPHVAVPIRLIVLRHDPGYSLAENLYIHSWVIPPFEYRDPDHLLTSLDAKVIKVAEAKRVAIERRREALSGRRGSRQGKALPQPRASSLRAR